MLFDCFKLHVYFNLNRAVAVPVPYLLAVRITFKKKKEAKCHQIPLIHNFEE